LHLPQQPVPFTRRSSALRRMCQCDWWPFDVARASAIVALCSSTRIRCVYPGSIRKPHCLWPKPLRDFGSAGSRLCVVRAVACCAKRWCVSLPPSFLKNNLDQTQLNPRSIASASLTHVWPSSMVHSRARLHSTPPTLNPCPIEVRCFG